MKEKLLKKPRMVASICVYLLGFISGRGCRPYKTTISRKASALLKIKIPGHNVNLPLSFCLARVLNADYVFLYAGLRWIVSSKENLCGWRFSRKPFCRRWMASCGLFV